MLLARVSLNKLEKAKQRQNTITYLTGVSERNEETNKQDYSF